MTMGKGTDRLHVGAGRQQQSGDGGVGAEPTIGNESETLSVAQTNMA